MARRRVDPGPSVRGAALAALLFAVPALAQPPRPAVPETTLYLVLRTGPDEQEKGILATLKQGIEKSGAVISGEPSIKAVSPALFEELQALADRGGAPVAAAEEGLTIRSLLTRDTMYEVRLQPTQVLKKWAVEYKKAGKKEYAPSAPGEKGPLVLTVPGRYGFTPEAGDTPVSYEGQVAQLGKPDTTVKGTWPKEDKYFVVVMRNFRGDKQRLFQVVQDKNEIANPLKVVVGDDLLFAFADLNSSGANPEEDELDEDNNLNVKVRTVKDRKPARVWVYFPLDEQTRKEALAQFRKFDSTELPVEIRKNAVTAADKAVLGPKDGPRWIELPAAPDTPAGTAPEWFARKIKLDDLPELTAKYPQLHMLIVWEFDAGKPEAIHVNDKDERVDVIERERPGWQKVIKKVNQKAVPKP